MSKLSLGLEYKWKFDPRILPVQYLRLPVYIEMYTEFLIQCGILSRGFVEAHPAEKRI